MLHKEITDSADEKTNRHTTTKQNKQDTSQQVKKGSETRREEEEWGEWVRSRLGSSGQAGNVSLWRGANWLGAALVGFSFKHHD